VLTTAGCGNGSGGGDGGQAATPTGGAPAPAPVVPVNAEAPVVAEPALLDMGFIEPKGIATGTIMLRNASDTPITILASQPSCKCTSVDMSGKVIPPGEAIPMDVEMEGPNQPGPKKASVKLLFEGYSRVLEVNLKTEVALAVRAVPGYINLVPRAAGAGDLDMSKITGKIVVESIDERPFRILSVNGETPDIVGVDDPANMEPNTRFLLNYDMNPHLGQPAGPGLEPPIVKPLPKYWVVETDHPDCGTLEVRVRHRSTLSVPKIRFKDVRINMSNVVEGEPAEFTIEVDAERTPDKIATVFSDNPDMKVDLVSQELSEDGKTRSVTIAATPKVGVRGLVKYNVIFYTETGIDEMMPAFGRVVEKGPF
jgi:hypothetical protein